MVNAGPCVVLAIASQLNCSVCILFIAALLQEVRDEAQYGRRDLKLILCRSDVVWKCIVYTVVANRVIVCWCKIFSQRCDAGCHVWMTDTNCQLQARVQI